MDRGAWRATVHGVAKSRTRLSDSTTAVWPGLTGPFPTGPAGHGWVLRGTPKHSHRSTTSAGGLRPAQLKSAAGIPSHCPEVHLRGQAGATAAEQGEPGLGPGASCMPVRALQAAGKARPRKGRRGPQSLTLRALRADMSFTQRRKSRLFPGLRAGMSSQKSPGPEQEAPGLS